MSSLAPRQRIALVVQYLGTAFHGWQRQPRQRTVQAELEQALAKVLGQPVTVHAAGRTDSGVHAAAQVVHFDAVSPIPAHRWGDVLNNHLPGDILVRGSAAVPATWHARFSALWRRYRYTLYTDPVPNLFVGPLAWHYYVPLETELMYSALQPLVGRRHLSAFRRAGSARPHSWVEVQEVVCQRRGCFVDIEVQASGFLYGMMRLLVGLLVQVGRGLRTPEEFTTLWAQECRSEVKYAAPAHGLCLLRVGYPEPLFPLSVWFDALPRLSLSQSDTLISLS